MRRLTSFLFLSLDGYFCDPKGDFRWAHAGPPDPEWSAFINANAEGGGELLFGRVTYEMMASYWPTAQAAANDPIVAKRMNQMPKLVASRSMTRPAWANTTVLGPEVVMAARELRGGSGKDITILGSGSIVAQLTSAGLIDEYQIVLIPVLLGAGRSPFPAPGDRLRLRLQESRSFANGNVFLRYGPS